MRPNIASLSVLCCLPMTMFAQSARQDRTFTLPAGVSVEAASLSRVRALVAAICTDRVVRVWSSSSGELLRTLAESGQPPRALGFSVDGRLLAVAYQIVAYEKGAIRVFDLDSWKAQDDFVAPVSPFVTFALSVSPDNRRLAFADINSQVWDLSSKKSLPDISPPFGGSAALSFSPDGRWVATADGDGFVRVHNADTGALRSTPAGFLLEPFAVAFSPDGKSLVTGGIDKTISIIDPETGRVLRTLPKQPGLIMFLDVSADGKQAAVVYNTPEHFLDVNHIMLWDLEKGTPLADFQKPGIILVGGAFVGDHYVFAAASGSKLTLWSIP